MDRVTGGGSPPSRIPLFLWVATAAFIVYGTTIPFDFVTDARVIHDRIAHLTWNPLVSPETGGRISITDFTSNVALFLPFGCFGAWTLRRWPAAARLAALIVASAVLSVGVETLQLFTAGRITSAADVLANTLGGTLGAVGGIVVASTARVAGYAFVAHEWTNSRALFPLLVATFVVFAGAWEPFDFTLDLGSVAPKVRSFAHDPLQFGVLADEALSILQHSLFTAALFVWLQDLWLPSAAFWAAAVGVVVAVGGEAGQLFVAARMPGLWDAAVGATGALIGVAVGASLARAGGRRQYLYGLVLVVATAAGAAMEQLSPFTFDATHPRTFQWMPFLNYYTFTTSQTVSHSAELLLAYFPMGFGLAMIVDARARWPLVLLASVCIAAPIEYLQRFVGDRYPDVTDVGLSVAGAAIGVWAATHGWQMFREEMRRVAEGRARSPV